MRKSFLCFHFHYKGLVFSCVINQVPPFPQTHFLFRWQEVFSQHGRPVKLEVCVGEPEEG